MIPENNILDTIISLVLIYALLSILVSILLEWWNHRTKARAIFLRKAIYHLLHDPLNLHYGQLFYNHYLIEGLKNDALKSKPQYISSQLFSEVLIDIIANQNLHDHPVEVVAQDEQKGKQYQIINNDQEPDVMKRFENQLNAMNPSPLSDTLKSMWQKSGGDYMSLKASLSFWYDDYMDRVSGWYKTRQRFKLIVFGFLVAIGLNVDSLHLVKVISMDDNLRNRLVLTAGQVADNYHALADSASDNTSRLIKTFNPLPIDTAHSDSTGNNRVKHLGDVIGSKIPVTKKLINVSDSINTIYIQKADSVLGIISSLDLPLGWDCTSAPASWFYPRQKSSSLTQGNGFLSYMEKRNRPRVLSIINYILGILITGISLSFGAPFWFETLVKLINIRRAGKKPEPVNVTK